MDIDRRCPAAVLPEWRSGMIERLARARNRLSLRLTFYPPRFCLVLVVAFFSLGQKLPAASRHRREAKRANKKDLTSFPVAILF